MRSTKTTSTTRRSATASLGLLILTATLGPGLRETHTPAAPERSGSSEAGALP